LAQAFSAVAAEALQAAGPSATGLASSSSQAAAERSTHQASTTTGRDAGTTCTSVSGALSLEAKVVRATGIAPLLVFFDATGTTDRSTAGGTTPFQEVFFTWNFGDPNSSGTGVWPYGSNAGHNSKNGATGAVAAHLYRTTGTDANYVVSVSAYDGANRASCQLTVSAYDPAGVHGFANKRTTCVAAVDKPKPGHDGCPAGAAVLRSADIGAALGFAFGSGRRVLFKCGDRFSGSYTIESAATTWSIGAYGGCEDTTRDRPVFSVPGGGTSIGLQSFNTLNGPADGRIADIDFEGAGQGLVAVTTTTGFNLSQITLYNLYARGLASAYYVSGGTQIGIVGSVMDGMGAREGVFWNYAGNNCLNGSDRYDCAGAPRYADVDYTAVIGNDFDGHGVSSDNTWETFRIAACRLCVFENNNFSNASPAGGATFKMHGANTWTTSATWIGQYTELIEISDNVFSGTSGAQLVETSPQNNVTDERLRNLIVERNLFAGTTAIGRDILVSAVNASLRNNVFYVKAAKVEYGAQIAQRGREPVAQHVEFYNNTCYAASDMDACAGFDGSNFQAAGIDSWAKNNLFFDSGRKRPAIIDRGAGNTVSHNTSDAASDPAMANPSGSFTRLADFMPSSAYADGTEVPVWFDALGVARGSWRLGALQPAASAR
jgi:hypothetical protein